MAEESNPPSGGVIENCDQLKSEVSATKDNEVGKQKYLIKRAVELGCMEHIPDNWGVDLDG